MRRYRRLFSTYLRGERRGIAFLAVLLLTSTAFQLAGPQLVKTFIDDAVAGEPTRRLTMLAGAFIAVGLTGQTAAVATAYLSERIGWSSTNLLRADLLTHALHLDIEFHHHHPPGEMIERIDGDVTALSQFFTQFVLRVVGSGLVLLGVVGLLWLQDYRLGLAITGYVAVAGFVLTRVGTVAIPALTADREATAQMYGAIEERLAGVDDIRANRGGDYALSRVAATAATMVRLALRARAHTAGVWTLATLLFAAGYLVLLATGAGLLLAGEVTIGTLYLVYQYTQVLQRPLEQLAEQLRQLQAAGAAVVRIDELFGFEQTITDGRRTEAAAGPARVEFDDVSFAYDAVEPVLVDLTVTVEAGTVLGVLGRTGSGKTTLVRLLTRLYEPQAGAVRIDGVAVEEFTLSALRHRVGVVTQEVQLFEATVRDNLTLFDRGIDDKRIHEALATLSLDGWLATLPHGLDTRLGADGAGLSAGEAQLLAFARVFLRDPGVVVLDEASSRLDPVTEALLDGAIERLLEGRTALVIAHRLGTVERADSILVLEDGRVREFGPREALAADPGSRFAELLRGGAAEVLA